MKTRRTIKGTSAGGLVEEAYTPSNPPPYPVVTDGSYPKMTAGKAIESNNNLLRNGDFRLNTQGQSSYPMTDNIETVDGWYVRIDDTDGHIEVMPNGGIKLVSTFYDATFSLVQKDLKFVTAGRTFTYTVKVSAVDADTPLTLGLVGRYQVSSMPPSEMDRFDLSITITEPGIYTVTNTLPENAPDIHRAEVSVNTIGTQRETNSYTIDWVKLEEGSVSTAPNGLVQNATQALYSNKASTIGKYQHNFRFADSKSKVLFSLITEQAEPYTISTFDRHLLFDISEVPASGIYGIAETEEAVVYVYSTEHSVQPGITNLSDALFNLRVLGSASLVYTMKRGSVQSFYDTVIPL